MKLYSLLATVSAGLAFLTTPVLAQEAAWQSSYQLEAAGKYQDATDALDAVPANSPEAEIKLIRRGWLYYLGGKLNESVREYRLAIERNGKSIDARLGLLLPLLAQQKWNDAEKEAKAALEIAPHNYYALLRLAVAQEGLKNWPQMASTSSTLVTYYPTDVTSYVYLARAHAWLNKRSEAVAAYTTVLTRVPGHLEAKAYLAKK